MNSKFFTKGKPDFFTSLNSGLINLKIYKEKAYCNCYSFNKTIIKTNLRPQVMMGNHYRCFGDNCSWNWFFKSIIITVMGFIAYNLTLMLLSSASSRRSARTLPKWAKCSHFVFVEMLRWVIKYCAIPQCVCFGTETSIPFYEPKSWDFKYRSNLGRKERTRQLTSPMTALL